MNDADWRRGLALLADCGLLFELQIFASQMMDGAKLARAFPDIVFVLEHAGMLEDLSPQGRAAWRDGMKRLAGEHNIVSKLSGLGTFIHRNDAAHIGAVLDDAVYNTNATASAGVGSAPRRACRTVAM